MTLEKIKINKIINQALMASEVKGVLAYEYIHINIYKQLYSINIVVV